MKNIFVILIFLISLSSGAAELAARSVTIGHQGKETISLVPSKNIWVVRFLIQGDLITARVITDETYQQIMSDWKASLIGQKSDEMGGCSQPIWVEKGVQSQVICSENWSQDQRLRFNSFYKKLKSLVLGQSSFYE